MGFGGGSNQETAGQVLQSHIGRERETASVTLEKKGFRHLFSEEKEPDPAPYHACA